LPMGLARTGITGGWTLAMGIIPASIARNTQDIGAQRVIRFGQPYGFQTAAAVAATAGALIPQVEKVTRPRDCAEAIEDDEQSPTINQAMAMLVVDFIHRLLTGALANMGHISTSMRAHCKPYGNSGVGRQDVRIKGEGYDG